MRMRVRMSGGAHMALGAVVAVVIALVAGTLPVHAGKKCLLKPTKKHPVQIDLSDLTTKIDYIAKSTLVQTNDFDFNICGDIEFSDDACPPGTMICERYKGQGDPKGKTVYGVTKDLKLKHAPENDDGITAILSTEGEKCPSSNAEHYSAEIRFKCAKGGFNLPTVQEESELNCFVAIQFPTPLACGEEKEPKASGISAGTVIVILIFVLPTVYMMLGASVLYSRGARGSELIAHRDFWADLPSLIADGFRFTVMKLTNRRVASYSTL